MAKKTIDCPECWGGSRRPPGPCPTCGPNDRIAVGSNGIPRGMGDRGGLGISHCLSNVAKLFTPRWMRRAIRYEESNSR